MRCSICKNKDFWDKMVDAGIINGAHETGHIRRNLDGIIKSRYVGDKADM